MKLLRTPDQTCIVERLQSAESYFTRLKGLIGKKEFKNGEGLLFPRCNSIHMWMMSIPIDAVFLKSQKDSSVSQWVVTSIHRELKPWKLLPVMDSSADDVLELPAGTASAISLKVGEVLCIAW